MLFFGNGIVLIGQGKKVKFDISERETPDGFGILETNDEYECKKLIELGYKHKGEMPKAPEEAPKKAPKKKS